MRRLDDREIVEDGVHVAAPIGQRPSYAQRHQLHHARKHVGEGQESEKDVAGIQWQAVYDHLRIDRQRVLREATALWRARRSRRVDQRGEILWPDAGTRSLQALGIRSGSPLLELCERHRVCVLTSEDDRVLKPGSAAPARKLLHLRRVVAEDHACAGVVEHVTDFLGGIGVEDRDQRRTHQHRPDVGLRPLRAGARENRHPVARADAEIQQSAGDRSRFGVELRISELTPCSAGGMALRQAGALFAGADNGVDQRRVGIQMSSRRGNSGCSIPASAAGTGLARQVEAVAAKARYVVVQPDEE